MSEHLLLFIIANSFFITIFPLLYLHHVYDSLTEHEKEQSKLSDTTLNMIIPVALGLLFAVLYPFLRDLGVPRKVQGIYIRFSLAGAIAALIISMTMDHFLNIYETWFEFDNPLMIHLIVAGFYFCVFQIIGTWIYKRIAEVFDEDSSNRPPVATTSPPISRSGSPLRLPIPSISSVSSTAASSDSASSASSQSSKSELYDKMQTGTKSN